MIKYWYFVARFTDVNMVNPLSMELGNVVYIENAASLFFPVDKALSSLQTNANLDVVILFWAEISKDAHDAFLKNQQKMKSSKS